MSARGVAMHIYTGSFELRPLDGAAARRTRGATVPLACGHVWANSGGGAPRECSLLSWERVNGAR